MRGRIRRKKAGCMTQYVNWQSVGSLLAFLRAGQV
jgi:hypothetical protein